MLRCKPIDSLKSPLVAYSYYDAQLCHCMGMSFSVVVVVVVEECRVSGRMLLTSVEFQGCFLPIVGFCPNLLKPIGMITHRIATKHFGGFVAFLYV